MMESPGKSEEEENGASKVKQSATEMWNELDISPSVCFLIREHAKSMVAIKELQNRVHILEDSPSYFFNMISSSQNLPFGTESENLDNRLNIPHLKYSPQVVSGMKSACFPECTKVDEPKQKSCFSPKTLNFNSKKIASSFDFNHKSDISSKSGNNLHSLRKKLPNQIDTSKVMSTPKKKQENEGTHFDSDKQDSGLDSDCRDQYQEVKQTPRTLSSEKGPYNKLESEDELLSLLQEIGEKGHFMQKRLEELESFVINGDVNSSAHLHHEGKYRLFVENETLQRDLNMVRRERDELRTDYNQLQSYIQRLEIFNSKLQQKLDFVLFQKHQLEFKINNSEINGREPQNSELKTEYSEIKVPKVLPKAEFLRSKIFSTSENREKVGSILKENSVMELKKNLLAFLWENEVLKNKFSHSEQNLKNKEIEWAKLENSLKDQIKYLIRDKQETKMKVEEGSFELSAMKSKIKMLEQVLKAVTLENRELNWQLGEALAQKILLLEKRNEFFNKTSATENHFKIKRHYNSTLAKELDFDCAGDHKRAIIDASSLLDISLDKLSSSPRQLNTSNKDATSAMNKQKLNLSSQKMYDSYMFSQIPTVLEECSDSTTQASPYKNSKSCTLKTVINPSDSLAALEINATKLEERKEIDLGSFAKTIFAANNIDIPIKVYESEGQLSQCTKERGLLPDNISCMHQNRENLERQSCDKKNSHLHRQNTSQSSNSDTNKVHRQIQNFLNRLTASSGNNDEALV